MVATPEEMPVNETIELAGRLEAETNVDLAAVIVNRVLPELFGRGEEAGLRSARGSGRTASPRGRTSATALGRSSTPPAWRSRLRRTRAEHLDHLRASLPPTLPLLFVPELFTKAHGLRSTRQVADALAAELGY